MAIYHLSVKIHSRSAGMSAVAGAAYRAGADLVDERTGETHDYTRRGAVDHTEILAPDDAPSWVQDRGRLWNEVEAAETRKNSQVAREIVVALPKELEAGAQRHLVRGFVSEQCVSRGMVADVAYHDVGSGNPHAHVLLTTRRIDPDGFAGKDRSWNDRGVVEDWRREWAEHANRSLARAQVMDRIDHRSLASQRQDALQRGDAAAAAALDRPAGVHLGRARHQEVRTGLPAARVSRALEASEARTSHTRRLGHHREHRSPATQSMDALAREAVRAGRDALYGKSEQRGPSGLQRISTFDRELRQAIERAAAALRECVRELRHEVDRVARWLREMQERQREAEARRQREAEAQRQREAEAQRQREAEAQRQREARDRDGGPTRWYDRDRDVGPSR